MAHILCITSGLTGMKHSSFELVTRLQALGHNVTYASPKNVKEHALALGFQFYKLPNLFDQPAPTAHQSKGLLPKIKRVAQKVINVRHRREEAISKLGTNEFRKALEILQPDLVLVDIELHEYIITSYSMKIPVVLLSQWFALWKRNGLPPLSSDILPGRRFRGSSLGIGLAWILDRSKRRRNILKNQLRSFFANRRSALLKYAHNCRFPKRYFQHYHWPTPMTYSRLPVLSTTLYEMEFPHVSVPWLHYLGPMVLENRIDLNADSKVIDKLEEIAKNKGRKSIIYCSLSTMENSDTDFLKKIITVFKIKSSWILIVGMGNKTDLTEFESVPPNVFLFPWVPQLQVLKMADCSINHGGINTINECIHFKVPMLVYSGMKHDQNGCAARVHYHGLGIMANSKQDTAKQIQHKISEILTSSYYLENVTAMYQHYQKCKQSGLLKQVIEESLSQGKTSI